jgi:hypothetical protein
MRINKKLLDIGADRATKITWDMIDDSGSATRKMINHEAAQTIDGEKDFYYNPAIQAPDSLTYTANSFVPKVKVSEFLDTHTGLMLEEERLITADEVTNGELTLAVPVFPGYENSFQIKYYEGAGPLNIGLDYDVAADSNGDLTRIVWSTHPDTLGRPGRVVEGNEIIMQYYAAVSREEVV